MADSLSGIRVGMLGVGNMGGAIHHGVIQAGLMPPADFCIYDIEAWRIRELTAWSGCSVAKDLTDLIRHADILVLAVKPQGIGKVLADLADRIDPARHCIVSIAAGVPIARIAERLPTGTRIVRVMPNTPCLVGVGMSAVSAGPAATEQDTARVCALFESVGKVVRVDESQMDAVTAVSGSGPAYVFHLAECLIAAATAAGLPDATAETLVRQTLLGAATLLARSSDTPAALRERVTSPGGTTAAALEILATHGSRGMWVDAVAAAKRRGAELAATA